MELNCGCGSKTNRLPKLYNLLRRQHEKNNSTWLGKRNAITSLSHQRVSHWILKGHSGKSSVRHCGRRRPRKCASNNQIYIKCVPGAAAWGREKMVFWTSIKQHAGVCNLPNGPRRSDLSNNREPAWRTNRSYKITAFFPLGWSLRTHFSGSSFTSYHPSSVFCFVFYAEKMWNWKKRINSSAIFLFRKSETQKLIWMFMRPVYNSALRSLIDGLTHLDTVADIPDFHEKKATAKKLILMFWHAVSKRPKRKRLFTLWQIFHQSIDKNPFSQMNSEENHTPY